MMWYEVRIPNEDVGNERKNDTDYAVGFVTNEAHRYLLMSKGKRDKVETLKALHLTPNHTFLHNSPPKYPFPLSYQSSCFISNNSSLLNILIKSNICI